MPETDKKSQKNTRLFVVFSYDVIRVLVTFLLCCSRAVTEATLRISFTIAKRMLRKETKQAAGLCLDFLCFFGFVLFDLFLYIFSDVMFCFAETQKNEKKTKTQKKTEKKT